MAAKPHKPMPDALDELEGAGERMALWIQQNFVAVVSGIALLIALVGGIGFLTSSSERREQEASSALEKIRSEYLAAMGAAPGATEVPQLANPEAAREIRAEYAARFQAIADEHPGTVAAALATLQIGNLTEDGGESQAAIDIWQQALAPLPGDATLRAILLERIAQAHEDAGRWPEAAAAHEQAGAIDAYPLRTAALAAAARSYATAGDDAKALELYERVSAESGALGALGDDIPSRLRELRAAAQN